MQTCTALPLAESIFNAIALFFTLLGLYLVKKRHLTWHKRSMLAAVAASAVFLGLYLIYHSTCPNLTYQGNYGFLYYPFLIMHIVFAACVPVLVAKTLWHAFRQEFDQHRRIARWTLPIWVYVSTSGIGLYLWLH